MSRYHSPRPERASDRAFIDAFRECLGLLSMTDWESGMYREATKQARERAVVKNLGNSYAKRP